MDCDFCTAAEAELARLRTLATSTADGHGGVLFDQPAIRRQLSAFGVRLMALQALESGYGLAEVTPASRQQRRLLLALGLSSLRQDLAQATVAAAGHDALALPSSRRGDNEPPIGNAIGNAVARQAVASMLAGRCDAEAGKSPDSLRDQLAQLSQ